MVIYAEELGDSTGQLPSANTLREHEIYIDPIYFNNKCHIVHSSSVHIIVINQIKCM